MDLVERWMYIWLEVVKILVILLFGMILNVVMLVKANQGESVEGFILSILFFILAFCFWYVADVNNFVLKKQDANTVMMVFIFTSFGYIALLGGLAQYFTANVYWIGAFLLVGGGLSWKYFNAMLKGLIENARDQS